jgi:hypothetical protein
LNDTKPRDLAHKFYILRAPQNGHSLQFWPVTGFSLEDSARDLVILEALPPAQGGISVPAVPLSMTAPPDGTPVFTYGCPAPAVSGGSVTPQGDLVAIQTILFTHANLGIVAAQYEATPLVETLFEFSVGWHHGESGGPVFVLEPRIAAFAVMQHYRNIQGPHGVIPGPRRGLALNAIRSALANAGATFI